EEKNELVRRLERSKQIGVDLNEKVESIQEQRDKDFSNYDRYRANFKKTREGLEAEIRQLKADLKVKSMSHLQLETIRERVRTISSLDGKLWNRPTPQGTPLFTPRNMRQTRIISILN